MANEEKLELFLAPGASLDVLILPQYDAEPGTAPLFRLRELHMESRPEWHPARILEVRFGVLVWCIWNETCVNIPEMELTTRLAPAGKVTRSLLWPGNQIFFPKNLGFPCNPDLETYIIRTVQNVSIETEQPNHGHQWNLTFTDNFSWNYRFTPCGVPLRSRDSEERRRWSMFGFQSACDFPIGMCFTGERYEGNVTLQLVARKEGPLLRFRRIRRANDLKGKHKDSFIVELSESEAMTFLRPLYSVRVSLYNPPWLTLIPEP